MNGATFKIFLTSNTVSTKATSLEITLHRHDRISRVKTLSATLVVLLATATSTISQKPITHSSGKLAVPYRISSKIQGTVFFAMFSEYYTTTLLANLLVSTAITSH